MLYSIVDSISKQWTQGCVTPERSRCSQRLSTSMAQTTEKGNEGRKQAVVKRVIGTVSEGTGSEVG